MTESRRCGKAGLARMNHPSIFGGEAMQFENGRLHPGGVVHSFLRDPHQSVGFRHFAGTSVFAAGGPTYQKDARWTVGLK